MKDQSVFKRAGAIVAIAAAALVPSLTFAQGASGAAWNKVVEAAKKEGAVTIYSSQGLVLLNDLAERFKKEYGINVTVVRAIDAEAWPKVDAEFSTGRGIADVHVAADEAVLRDRHTKGYFVAPIGPAFDNPAYNRKLRVPQGTYFESNAFVVAFGWNKDLFNGRINDYPDLLNPAFTGRIGVPNPSSQALVDFYLFLEQNFGADFVVKLAALKPRIYPGALPLGQALVSGEIAAAAYNQPLVDEQKKGAPVEWKVADKAWGARFWGQVLKAAPHPNAAQVLANYMITPPGQEAVARMTASVLPNIPGTLTTTDKVHRQDLSKLNADTVKAYQEKWRKLFVQQ